MAKNIEAEYTDLETGLWTFYLGLSTSEIQMRWAFIRKIYSILTLQILLTVVVASVVVFVRPVSDFFVTTTDGIGLYICFLILSVILACLLYLWSQKHPLNLFLLALFTICISFAVGLTCAFTNGKIILESAILTAVVVASLTAYTFWAEKKGHDFSILASILLAGIMVLLVFFLIQIIFPLGRVSVMIYCALASMVFCGYIIYDTSNVIVKYSYDEYIWASVALYVDIINLFGSLLTILSGSDT